MIDRDHVKTKRRFKARTAVRTRDLAQFRWVPKARIIPLDHPGLDTISIAQKIPWRLPQFATLDITLLRLLHLSISEHTQQTYAAQILSRPTTLKDFTRPLVMGFLDKLFELQPLINSINILAVQFEVGPRDCYLD